MDLAGVAEMEDVATSVGTDNGVPVESSNKRKPRAKLPVSSVLTPRQLKQEKVDLLLLQEVYSTNPFAYHREAATPFWVTIADRLNQKIKLQKIEFGKPATFRSVKERTKILLDKFSAADRKEADTTGGGTKEGEASEKDQLLRVIFDEREKGATSTSEDSAKKAKEAQDVLNIQKIALKRMKEKPFNYEDESEKSEEDQQRGLTPIEETVEEAIVGSKTNPKTDNTNVSQVKKRRFHRGTAAERMMSKKIRADQEKHDSEIELRKAQLDLDREKLNWEKEKKRMDHELAIKRLEAEQNKSARQERENVYSFNHNYPFDTTDQ